MLGGEQASGLVMFPAFCLNPYECQQKPGMLNSGSSKTNLSHALSFLACCICLSVIE